MSVSRLFPQSLSQSHALLSVASAPRAVTPRREVASLTSASPGLSPIPSAASAPAALSALDTPGMLRPPVLVGVQRNVDAQTMAATRELTKAVDINDWKRADRAASLLGQHLARGPSQLSTDAQDDIHLALSHALGAAEKAEAWSFLETLLSIFALGIPWLVDALVQTDVERLGAQAITYRRDLSRELATSLVHFASGADASDAAVVSEELAKLPPAILRVLIGGGAAVYCVRNNIYDGMNVDFDDLPPEIRFGSAKVMGATDRTTNRINIRTQYWPVGGPKIPHPANMNRGSTVLHEAMHAYDNLMGGASRTRDFMAALAADEAALSSYEAQSDPERRRRESYAETCARYLGGDHSLETSRPNLWRYCRSTFGPR